MIQLFNNNYDMKKYVLKRIRFQSQEYWDHCKESFQFELTLQAKIFK